MSFLKQQKSTLRDFVRHHPFLWKIYKSISKRTSRIFLILAMDLGLAALTVPVALVIRFNDITAYPLDMVLLYSSIFTLVALGCYLITQSYTRLWRTFSPNDLLAYVKLCLFIFLIYTPMFWALNTVYSLPRSVPLICFFVQVSGLITTRYLYFSWRTAYFGAHAGIGKKERFLILGNDNWLETILHKQQGPTLDPYKIVGIIHRNKNFKGRSMYGVPVIGAYQDLKSIVAQFDHQQRPLHGLLLADTHTLTPSDYRDLLELAFKKHFKIQKIIPQSSTSKKNIRLGGLMLEDLLGRPEIDIDQTKVKQFFAGKRVLVTGAGGSIGSELVRQLALFKPAEITLVESSEHNLYTIDHEMAATYSHVPRRSLLGDVRHASRMEEIFRLAQPQVVCHAAALKHVPMVELNPIEGIATNALGTQIIADACRAHGVETMVMISTDKAVNPPNVMGASKRLAELYCQSLDVQTFDRGERTQYITVRFGNVLGSAGSVVPLFERQIREGGPVTVTHPKMVRYFMTIKESVSLILQAAAMESGAHHTAGKIYVLDMGDPVNISDLARQMILLSGKVPGQDIKITYTGIRPGEKLFEELFYDSEAMEPTPHGKIFKASPDLKDYHILSRMMENLGQSVKSHDKEAALHLLKMLVPEFMPAAQENPAPVNVKKRG